MASGPWAVPEAALRVHSRRTLRGLAESDEVGSARCAPPWRVSLAGAGAARWESLLMPLVVRASARSAWPWPAPLPRANTAPCEPLVVRASARRAAPWRGPLRTATGPPGACSAPSWRTPLPGALASSQCGVPAPLRWFRPGAARPATNLHVRALREPSRRLTGAPLPHSITKVVLRGALEATPTARRPLQGETHAMAGHSALILLRHFPPGPARSAPNVQAGGLGNRSRA